jgi:hypothetical protein
LNSTIPRRGGNEDIDFAEGSGLLQGRPFLRRGRGSRDPGTVRCGLSIFFASVLSSWQYLRWVELTVPLLVALSPSLGALPFTA